MTQHRSLKKVTALRAIFVDQSTDESNFLKHCCCARILAMNAKLMNVSGSDEITLTLDAIFTIDDALRIQQRLARR